MEAAPKGRKPNRLKKKKEKKKGEGQFFAGHNAGGWPALIT
jgi:hypothetical protein